MMKNQKVKREDNKKTFAISKKYVIILFVGNPLFDNDYDYC